MRFVWAVAAFVLAALLIGAGIAQRTAQPPSTQSAEITAPEDAPYTLIDGTVMGMLPGNQTLSVAGDDGVFVAYGRTADMKAWLSDQTYNAATVGPDDTVVVTTVEPDAEAAAQTEPSDPEAAETDAAAARTPVGSDLWLGEFQDDAELTTPLQIPDGMSVLVASDGSAAAPADISVTWPRDTATPWAGPLIVLGGVFLIVGIVLYILAIRHTRRSRGPRRKAPPPLPPTEPIDLGAIEDEQKGVVPAAPPRRRLGRGRALVAFPALLLAPVLFAGCSSDIWPQFDSSPSPTPTETVVDAEDQQQPAVTRAQAEQIVQRIAETVAQADASLDANLAATRLDGPALAARKTNYTLRASLTSYAALPAITSDSLQIILPQAFDEWPRSVLAVADSDTESTVLMLTQADPWSNYKLVYTGSLGGSTQLPDLAPDYIGASQVPPESTFLSLPPDELAAAYADVLTYGDKSRYAALFDETSDAFSAGVVADRQKRLDDFNATGAETGTLEFSAAAGTQQPLALATLESGAIVAVTVTETDTAKPTDSGVVIKFENNPTVQTLTGVAESATGVTTTFQDQLFFYVPAQGSSDKIRILGYSSNILEAKVIP